MRKLASTLIVLLLGLTTVIVVGLLLLTLFLPTLLQRFGCTPYGIRCAIGQAHIRPRQNLTADLVLDHLVVFDPDGQGVALRVKRLAATLNLSSLIRTRQGMPIEVRIERPELLVRQLDDGRWNIPALAQEAQRRLQPAARPTTWQFPRVSIVDGAFQIGSYRATDVSVTLESKADPMLVEMQARVVAGRRSIRISGALRNVRDGQILAQIQEDHLQGVVRFQLDHPDRAITISEWSFETDGALARGKAAIRYADWPPAYTLTIEQWHADLSVLAQQFSLPWLSPFTGVLDGQPTTLQGRWPNLPDGQVAATMKDGEVALPAHQSQVTELIGGLSLQSAGSRLRLQGALRGKTVLLFGQRYNDPSLLVSFSADPTTGDVTAEDLRASISGGRIGVKGGGRRWGRDGLDLATTELRIEPAILTHLSRWTGTGMTITRAIDPSIRLWWLGAGRPWNAEISGRSIELHATTADVRTTLQDPVMTVRGVGVSEYDLEGTLGVRQADLGGRRLRSLTVRFDLGPHHVRISEFHVAVGNGDIQGHVSFFKAAPLQEVRVALSVRGLRPQSLFTPAEQSTQTPGVALNAEISADATFSGSQPRIGSGRVTIRDLSFNLARQAVRSAAPVMRLRGSIPFALGQGLLTIPETTLHEDGGLALILTGSLPLGHSNSHVARARLSVPWTEVSALRSTLTAMTGDRPETARLVGQFRTDLEISDKNYRGTLAMRNVGIESNFFRVDNVTGVIPLHGRTDSTSVRRVDQGSAALTDPVSPVERIGRRRLSEQDYQAAIAHLSMIPTQAPASLTISSLRYDPIELRNIEVALASSEGRIAIQRFAFKAWDGRWGGWGAVEPFGRGIAMTILTEGLSLRAICNAFPPIKGYISGRINGIADLSIPRLALSQAEGKARFWVVDSPQEGRKISRALIERLAGQQIRYFSLFGVPRRYDRGVLDVALKAGDLSFHELEISHTTPWSKDLNVQVSPTFNKIGLAHLLESINEAIERIRAGAESNQ
ncbi:hypothetical protein MELA_00878 [Candidatus Methylomirabilis lanthanidiphila]|uniref:Uncharacterized protein n=1 Tax=Candidatus Methylomirabilis lanthanidiphila TaxID=2211376 RepID=A0A564ZGS4_9BACT|nr:hypothetical protein [Candidatus Methylomirabilis lanthanidiphila]VUZ84505.1 hypothetical protein MELA_00878 [Candidatus Methylomirabilis lanthanidiphila]